MKPFILLFAIVLLLTVTSCKKESEYAKGYVLVGVKNTVSLESVFTLMNSFDLYIQEAEGFYYVCPLPEDSLKYVGKILDAKPYFNTQQFQARCYYDPSAQGIVILTRFFYLNATNQQDWIQTSRQLQLTGLTKDVFKDLILRVPEGTEKDWVKKLKGYDMFRWVELNEVLQLGP